MTFSARMVSIIASPGITVMCRSFGYSFLLRKASRPTPVSVAEYQVPGMTDRRWKNRTCHAKGYLYYNRRHGVRKDVFENNTEITGTHSLCRFNIILSLNGENRRADGSGKGRHIGNTDGQQHVHQAGSESRYDAIASSMEGIARKTSMIRMITLSNLPP